MLHAGFFGSPARLHLVIHAQRGGLVYRNHHRLANKAPAQKVLHNILRHHIKAVVTRNQVVLPPQRFFQLVLLLGIQIGIFNQAVNIVIQIRVNQLQLRRAVFVKQRHRSTIFNRLLKIVNRHIIAKHFFGALLARNQRRACKRQKQRTRQGRAHIQRQRVVLAAVRLIGQHNHIVALAQHLGRLKLMHQRKHIAVVAA